MTQDFEELVKKNKELNERIKQSETIIKVKSSDDDVKFPLWARVMQMTALVPILYGIYWYLTQTM